VGIFRIEGIDEQRVPGLNPLRPNTRRQLWRNTHRFG